MSRFEYLTTFVFIVLGLGVADLLESAYRLIQARRRVHFHWLPVVWAAMVFMIVVLFFWDFYVFGQSDLWRNFLAFLFLLVGPILLFLASANALPDEIPPLGDSAEEVFDLERFYFERPGGFFVLLAGYALNALASSLLRGQPLWSGTHVILVSSVSLFVAMAWSRNRWLHTLATLAAILILGSYIALYALQNGYS